VNRGLTVYSNIELYENCPVVADLFRADGRTDMTKIMVAFCSFANAPEIEPDHL